MPDLGYTRDGAQATLLAWYGHLVLSGFQDRQGDWKKTQECRDCQGTGARGYDTSQMIWEVHENGTRHQVPTKIPCVVCGGTGRDPTRGFDPATGAPRSETDLAPRWRALGGTALALAIVLVPRSYAKACLHRLKLGRKDRALAAVPEEQWTWQENLAVQEFTICIKLAVHHMATWGWFDPQPLALGLEEGHRLPLNVDDGMTDGFKITPEGVKEAVEFARQHPELKWEGPETDYGEDAWNMAPEWLKKHWKSKPAIEVSA